LERYRVDLPAEGATRDSIRTSFGRWRPSIVSPVLADRGE
jgi:hypothetical protein